MAPPTTLRRARPPSGWPTPSGRRLPALGVGRDAVYNAINRGELRAVRFGGTTLVPRVELERLLGIAHPAEPVAVAEILQELAQILAAGLRHPSPLAR